MTHVQRSGTHTASSSPAASNRASVRASSRSVFARAWRMPVSAGETTITRATCPWRMRAISHEFAVTSSATRSSAARLSANSSRRLGVVSTRPAERTVPFSQIATSQKSRCTSNPMSLNLIASQSLDTKENRWANDIDGSALGAHLDKSQGRPMKRAGSKPIAQKRPAQPAFSQRPLSQSPDPTGRTLRQQPQRRFSCREKD